MKVFVVGLIAAAVGYTLHDPPSAEAVFGEGALGEARARGVLRVATVNGPVTVYEARDGLAGFEHDLALAYAEHLGVEAAFDVRASVADALAAVDAGEADIAAAGLALSSERVAVRRFSPIYAHVGEAIVCRRGEAAEAARRDVTGVTLEIADGAVHAETLAALEDAGVFLEWRVRPGMTVNHMLAEVSAGRADCTIADTRSTALTQRYLPDLVVVDILPGARPLAWAATGGRGARGAALGRDMAAWFEGGAGERAAETINERYFGFRPEEIETAHAAAFRRAVARNLDTYRAMFEAEADRVGAPWTLIAAVAYQESHWNASARSPTGVRGLMMLTRATAGELGVSNRLDPAEALRGGADYLRRMYNRFPDEIAPEERWWFAAASYNMGYGHVVDARSLVASRGGDPNHWPTVRDVLHELEDPAVYQTLPHGYGNGRQARLYVQRVRDYADVLDAMFTRREAAIVRIDAELEPDESALEAVSGGGR